MYKPHAGAPSKFGRPASTHKAKPRFGGGGPRKFNNSRPKFGGNKKKSGGHSRGERIDFSRFIKHAEHVEEKPYVSKHTFADFPFNPQLHINITRVGYIEPRPIQDQ